MTENRFPRRYFFYGTLLAGAIPRGGFGRAPVVDGGGQVPPREM